MKILVTGATGFIGNHLIERLLSKNHFVIATSSSFNKAVKFSWFSKVKYIEYDLSQNHNVNLFDFFDKPDLLIHLAWKGLPNYENLIHIEYNLMDQYFFLKNLINGGLKKVAVTGTCFEYGFVNGEISANTTTYPQNSYAISKDTLRKFLFELQKVYYFELKWLRLFYLYGEGQSPSSLYSQLIENINNNADFFNMSLGEQIRDFSYIKDAIEQIISISVNTEGTFIENICSGCGVSVRSFVEKIIEEKKSNIKLNLGYYKYSPLEPFEFWGKKSNSIL